MSEEQWKPIVGYEEYYAISDHGRVMRIKASTGTRVGKIVKPVKNRRGYLTVALSVKQQRVRHYIHKFVMNAFVGIRPDGYEVNHKDGNKQNNALGNLEYVTSSDNKRHAFATGLKIPTRGSLAGRAKLTWEQVREMRALFATGRYTKVELSAQFGVHEATIGKIVNGQRWIDGGAS